MNTAKEEYTQAQMEEIQLGEEKGIDVAYYRNPKFMASQMEEIRLGLEHEIQVAVYAKPVFDFYQMREIRLGLEQHIDVTSYASPDFDSTTMCVMRQSILDKVDLSFFVSQGFRGNQLLEIKKCVEEGFHIKKLVQCEMREAQLKEIRIGLEQGINVYVYADIQYHWRQMRELRLGLEHQLEVTHYLNANFNSNQMKEIRLGLEEGLDVSRYATLMFSAREMHKRRICMEEELANAPKQAIPGADGYFEFFFQENPIMKFQIQSDGSIDYEQFQLPNMVSKGKVIAIYHKAQLGEPGRDAQGNEIPGKKGKELAKLYGQGFHLDSDQKTYYADVTGVVQIERDGKNSIIKYGIEPVTVIEQKLLDVTPELRINGTVIVQGDISQGHVEATGDVILRGEYTGGEIVSGRDVVAIKGAQCLEQGIIQAKKNVYGDIFNNVIIRTNGDVRMNGMIYTDIDTCGSVLVSGSLSQVVGGNIQAENGIEVYHLGNSACIPTTVEIGMNENAKHRLAGFKKERFQILNELKQLDESRDKIYEQLRNHEGSSAAVGPLLERIHDTFSIKSAQAKALDEEIQQLEQLKIRKNAPTIRVRGTAYAGSRLKIDGNVKIIDKEMQNVTIKKKDGGLQIIENQQAGGKRIDER